MRIFNDTIFKTCRFFLLTTILIVLIRQDFFFLFQPQNAVRIDGYYYILQINSFLEFGYFYFSTKTPLILYFLSALTLFTGNTILAVKLGAVILQIALFTGIAIFLNAITKNLLLSVWGVAVAAFSALHLYF